MIDAKKILTDGVFCPIPWTGVMYNFDGRVKNCIRSAGQIGDLKNQPIEDIVTGTQNLDTQDRMLKGLPGADCYTCYNVENNKKRFDIVSDRIFYIRELRHNPLEMYQLGNHTLQTIDIRWSNLCNFSCVYCGPEFSSRWASELNIHLSSPSPEQVEKFKQWVFDRAQDLQHVYLAGGEPLLMRQNLELLELLQKINPLVNLRINTNLSKVDTQVFDKICEFENVHWTVSVESMGDEFEYIRYGGKWDDFLENLGRITMLDHKISFNMLWFLLNFRSLFDTIDYFLEKGYHPNSFIAGPLLTPLYLNIRNLPEDMLQSSKTVLADRLAESPGYLLEDSYRNLLHYIQQPFDHDLDGSLQQIKIMDQRRGIDSKKVFLDLYKSTQGK